MQSVNEIMSFLETGNWSSFEDLISKCSLPECNVELVLNFLIQYDFLEVDEKKQIFRLHPDMIDLINRLDENKS